MKNRLRAAAVVVGALVVVTGCNGGSEQPAEKPSSSPTSKKPKDPQAKAKAAVLKAYGHLVKTQARIYATAKYDPDIEKFATDKALKDVKLTMLYYQDHGTVQKGKVKRSPKVTAINTESEPMKAIVTDCADSSHYDEVDAETGKVVSYDGPRRHIVTSTAYRSDSSDWKFYTVVIDRERTC